ncbi:MAG TPA: hypothetical protein GXZ91_08090 [Christensenellaceae bacterium]|jgi:hypothetical protein|nr:hypothetical protein [Christensenellaceae bacterium]
MFWQASFTSGFTFFASAGIASILGAPPVFVDINLETFNICSDDLERKIEQIKGEGKLSQFYSQNRNGFGSRTLNLELFGKIYYNINVGRLSNLVFVSLYFLSV